MPNMIYPPTIQQQPIGNQNHQQSAIKPPPPMMNHHPSQMPNMNVNAHQSMLNQSMNVNQQMQSGPPMYDHMLQNPMNGSLKGPSAAEFIYLNQQHPHHLNAMAQNQYTMPSRNNVREINLNPVFNPDPKINIEFNLDTDPNLDLNSRLNQVLNCLNATFNHSP
jgi:hypothetical protein